MTLTLILTTVAIYLCLVNWFAYVTFAHDKRMAVERGWRMPESSLLGLALLGGAFGIKLAQRRFRHKTRKQPFATLLNAALICNLVALGVLFAPGPRYAVANAIGDLLSSAAQGAAAERPARPRRFGPGSGN